MDEIRDKNGLTEAEFLANYKVKDYPRPSLTADILIFNQYSGELQLLLIKRGGHPFINKWALPGGFVQPNERADQAAARELLEETHVQGLPLEQLGLYSAPHRDPRAWVVSEAYCSLCNNQELAIQADDDAADAKWFDIEIIPDDNDKIKIYLQHNDDILSIEILGHDNHDLKQFCDGDTRIVASDGLAFDHDQMIWDGLKKYILRDKIVVIKQ